MKNELFKLIDENIDVDKIKDIIVKTSIVAWDSAISSADIDSWLENFDGSACGDEKIEKKVALWILMNFSYFTDADIKELCISIFNKYKHIKAIELKAIGSDEHINEYIAQNTLFVPLGNPSESGSLVLYSFRVANGLSKKLFEKNNEKYRDVVLIDDVTITGEQAERYIDKIDVEYDNLYFATFFATEDAIDNLKKSKNVKFINVMNLDMRTKIFDDESFMFSSEMTKKIKGLAKYICTYYGEKIVSAITNPDLKYMKKFPLGFGDSQQLIGFRYNTPDNVLPIIWGDTGEWKKIFTRYHKTNVVMKGEEHGEKYV